MLHQASVPASTAADERSPASSLIQFAAWLGLLLLLGVAIRLPFLPRLGHAYDQDAYRSWMGAIQDHGLAHVFERTDTDYVGYHYILWGLSTLHDGRASQATVRDKPLRIVLKLPGLVGDLLTAGLVAVIARSLARARVRALGARWVQPAALLHMPAADLVGLTAGALFLFHPAVIYAGSYWGQQDSLVTFFMLLSCWLVWGRHPGWAALVLALGVIVKPQPLVLAPVIAWLAWRRSGWAGLLRGGATGVVVLIAGHAYFLLNGAGGRIWEIYTFQITQNEHLTFSAYNLWWPFERLWDVRPETPVLTAGGVSLTYGLVASLLVLGALALTVLRLRRGDDVAMMIISGGWLAGYYLVAAGAHERYALPSLAFLLAALALATRLRWPLLLLSVAVFTNLVIALPLDRRWTQGDPVWLSIVVSIATVVAVGWVLLTAPAAGGVAPTPGPSPAARERGRG